MLRLATRKDDIRHVTEALEDGRYAVACVQARVEGRPLPTRRPPCFFNPAHGPSTTDIEWAPPGGQKRQIPVCAADEDRVQQGAEPDIRTVRQGVGRVPYWQGGPAYSPYASGYFGGYEKLYYTPGSRYPVFDLEEWRVGLLICYDWRFPEAARALAIQGAHLILYPFATGAMRMWLAQ